MNTPPRFFAAPPPPLSETKAQLRAAMRARRRQLHAEIPSAGRDAAQGFAAHGRTVEPGTVVAVYGARPPELDAGPLAQALAAAGARIVLPAVVEIGGTLAFRVAEGRSLTPDAARIPAPPVEAQALRPGLLFVPLLAFDRFGGRLGQGGGYYDRTLETLRASGPPVTAFGLAYAGQEVDHVPVDAHDAPLDGVLTERGLTLFNPSDFGDG